MSTVKATTVSNLAGTKTVPVDSIVDGVFKAWVNFNGTGTVAIRSSFNVTSITDNGTGYYTVNMTNAMTDTSYGIICHVPGIVRGYTLVDNTGASVAPTTTTFNVVTNNSTDTAQVDPSYVVAGTLR